MSLPIFTYPLDLTGKAATNKVVNEEYVIGLQRNRIFIPVGGPFFGNETVLVDLESGRELVPRQDYLLLHTYEEAEKRSQQPVYAGVRIVNSDVSTRIGFTSQHIGGEFSYSYYAIVQALKELENDNRPLYWGDLVGVPAAFVPLPHLQSTRTLYGWKGVIDALMMLEAAIRQGDSASRNLLIETVNAKFDEMNAWMDETDTKYNALAGRVSQTESRLNNHDQKMTGAEGQVPFFVNNTPFNVVNEIILQTVAIAHTDAEFSAIITAAPISGNPPIAVLHTDRVWTWNNTAYINSGASVSSVLKKGRFYRSPVTNRVYFAHTAGGVTMITEPAALKLLTSAIATRDRLVYTNTSNETVMGDVIQLYSQNPTTGAMTSLGRILKADGNTWDVRNTTGTDVYFYFGGNTARHAGIRANATTVGFVDKNGNWLGYFDNTGILQLPNGMNSSVTSDTAVKDHIVSFALGNKCPHRPDRYLKSPSDIGYYRWIWKSDDRLPERMWGTQSHGVLISEVEQFFPECVTVNEENGLKSVNQSLLTLAMNAWQNLPWYRQFGFMAVRYFNVKIRPLFMR